MIIIEGRKFSLKSLAVLANKKGYYYDPITRSDIVDFEAVSKISNYIADHSISIGVFANNSFKKITMLEDSTVIDVKDRFKRQFITVLSRSSDQANTFLLNTEQDSTPIKALLSNSVLCCEEERTYCNRILNNTKSNDYTFANLLFVGMLPLEEFISKYLLDRSGANYINYYSNSKKSIVEMINKSLTDNLDSLTNKGLFEILKNVATNKRLRQDCHSPVSAIASPIRTRFRQINTPDIMDESQMSEMFSSFVDAPTRLGSMSSVRSSPILSRSSGRRNSVYDLDD